MNYNLVVVHPFGTYAKGQMITDPAEVAAILAGPKHVYVNKIAAPADDSAPAAPDPVRVSKK